MKRQDDKNPFSWAELAGRVSVLASQGRGLLRGSHDSFGKPGASLLRLSPPSHGLLLDFLGTLHCHFTPVPETFNGPLGLGSRPTDPSPYCTCEGSHQRACTDVRTEGLLSLTPLLANLPQPCEACWKQTLQWDQNHPVKLYRVSVPRKTFMRPYFSTCGLQPL